jgi:hypothetical protein
MISSNVQPLIYSICGFLLWIPILPFVSRYISIRSWPSGIWSPYNECSVQNEFIGNFAGSNEYGEKPNWEILLIRLNNDEDARILHVKLSLMFLNLDWVTDTHFRSHGGKAYRNQFSVSC